jgi:hypothetical protein
MRKALLAAAAAALLAPATSRAQLSFGARLGYSQPAGDLEENGLVADQIPFQLDLDYRLALGFTIGAYGYFGQSAVESTEANCADPSVDCTSRTIRAGVQVTWTLSLPVVKPWVGAGFGYEWLRISRSNADALTTSGPERFNAQLGLDFSLGYFRLGPFLTYTISKYDAQALVDDTVGTADLETAEHGLLYYGIRVRVDP